MSDNNNKLPGGMQTPPPPPPPRPFGPPPGKENKPDDFSVAKQEEKAPKQKKTKPTHDFEIFETSLAKAGDIAKRKVIKTVLIVTLLLLFIGGAATTFVLIFNNLGYQEYDYRVNVNLSEATEFTVTSTVLQPGDLTGIENPISVYVPANEQNATTLNSLACFALEINFNKITNTGAKVNVNSLFSVQVLNSDKIYEVSEHNYREIGNKQFIDVKEDELIYFNTLLGAGDDAFEIVAGFMLKGNGNINNNDDSFNHNAYAGDTIEITVTVYSAYPSQDSIQNGSIGTYYIDPPIGWINIIETERIAREKAESLT